jgi:hypothetical protein
MKLLYTSLGSTRICRGQREEWQFSFERTLSNVNLWSTTCVPCMVELPELVAINRMYRQRHFELYTITTDPPDRREAAEKILREKHVSSANYIFDSEDRDTLAEALDPQWGGPLPYTILIEPGGNIVRRWKDGFDPAELKSEISTRLGKTYATRK